MERSAERWELPSDCIPGIIVNEIPIDRQQQGQSGNAANSRGTSNSMNHLHLVRVVSCDRSVENRQLPTIASALQTNRRKRPNREGLASRSTFQYPDPIPEQSTHTLSPEVRQKDCNVQASTFDRRLCTQLPEWLKEYPTPCLTPRQLVDLAGSGFPRGLASEMAHMRTLHPIRFWILDNAGGLMMTEDGRPTVEAIMTEHAWVRNKSHKKQNRGSLANGTRWAELREAATAHAKMAKMLSTSTIFCLLGRSRGDAGISEVLINGEDESATASRDCNAQPSVATWNLQSLTRMLGNAEPSRCISITRQLIMIGQKISACQSAMRRRNERAVIVLATDGLPTDADGQTSVRTRDEFINVLRQLQSLPTMIVVRLCTQDSCVVNYYQEVGAGLEMSFKVLKDWASEAAEIHKHNPWVNYGLPLHRCREMGYHHRLFELLVERPLTEVEVVEFAKLLLQPTERVRSSCGVYRIWDEGNLPLMTIDDSHDLRMFCRWVDNALQQEGGQLNPISNKIQPWLDTKLLQHSLKRSGYLKKLIRTFQ